MTENMKRIISEYEMEMKNFADTAAKWCFCDNEYRSKLYEQLENTQRLFKECIEESKYELAYDIFDAFTDYCMEVQRSGMEYMVSRLETIK
jgi:hypothetical protein